MAPLDIFCKASLSVGDRSLYIVSGKLPVSKGGMVLSSWSVKNNSQGIGSGLGGREAEVRKAEFGARQNWI